MPRRDDTLTMWEGHAFLHLHVVGTQPTHDRLKGASNGYEFLMYRLEDGDSPGWITIYDHRRWVVDLYRAAYSGYLFFLEHGKQVLEGVARTQVRQRFHVGIGREPYVNIYEPIKETPEALLYFSVLERRHPSSNELFFSGAAGMFGIMTLTDEEHRAVLYRGIHAMSKGGKVIFLNSTITEAPQEVLDTHPRCGDQFVVTGELPPLEIANPT